MKIGNNTEMKTKIAEAIFMVMNSESMINKWNMALHSHTFSRIWLDKILQTNLFTLWARAVTLGLSALLSKCLSHAINIKINFEQ